MRSKPTAAVLCAASAALLVAPAQAGASVWRGKTEQGRKVVVRTGADGLVNRVRVNWRARCARPGYIYRSQTVFVPPFDAVNPLAFDDGGPYRARLDGGLRVRLRTRVRGHISADLRRWRGSFRVSARVFRNGRRIDTCRVRGVRWVARLRD